MKKMHLYIDEELGKNKKDVSRAITNAFDRLEKEWIEIAQKAFHGGFAKSAYVGSCALVSIVHDNKLYVANAGDSKAAILRLSEDGNSFERIKASKTFNANKKYEQERLKKEFNEQDIVRCRSKDACYIKGNLMPSRALGDLRLKHAEFNFHNYSTELGYR